MSPPREARPSYVVQMARTSVNALPLLYPCVGLPTASGNINFNIRPFFDDVRNLPWFKVPVQIIIDTPGLSLGMRFGIATPSISPEPCVRPDLSSLQLAAFNFGIVIRWGHGYPHIDLNLDFDSSPVGSVVIEDDLPACSAEAKHHHALDVVLRVR